MTTAARHALRVFPRRTKATPTDDNVRIGYPKVYDVADEVHISVTFTWDLPLAERMAEAWSVVAPTKMGGPATGEAGGDFVPGLYLKKGYVITSRGCPNHCWFCNVWRREGQAIRELPITEGWNVLDDNLLACSDQHIKAVFAMLKEQKKNGDIQFTGGLEAARLKLWHVDELRALSPKQMFFAYDTPDDLEPLIVAGNMLADAGLSWSARAYVLCGYPHDTFDEAEERMMQTVKAGFMPMAMLYRDHEGRRDIEWSKFQRLWVRPAIIRSRVAA